jgi:hypothetical protein
MGKTYSVTLGGKEREFRYTRNERELLEDRFGIGLIDTIRTNVLPTGADGKPTGGGCIKHQTALVWAGLKHNGPKVTERAIAEWIDKLQEEGGNPYMVYGTAVAAVFASGVLGMTITEDETTEDKDEPEGKEASAETETS